jgi:hypothetical protein
MNMTNPVRSSARPVRREAPTHSFVVGQSVRLKGGFAGPPRPADIYRITGTLPPKGDSLQYRIRNDDERHERVTTQDSLELVGASPADRGATLIERTFGHGKGTETKLSRDQEAEAGKGQGGA